MARSKTQHVKAQGLSLGDRVLGNPDLVGKIGTATSSLANWANESKIHRRFMQRLLGIHKDKKLPPFASKTLKTQFAARRKGLHDEAAAKIAFFSTCYLNYNQPEIGLDTLEVMERNNVDVAFAYERCCGMPHWHNGDMDAAIEAAKDNVARLLRFVEEGRTVVATNPTCSQMIRVEYPRLLGTEDAKKVAARTTDPMDSHSEYVEGDSLPSMVREDLVAERVAIESYGEMIRYMGDKDPTTRPMLEGILAMEEEHAEDLSSILATIDPEKAAK